MKKKGFVILAVGALCGYIGYKYGSQLVHCVKNSINRKPIEELAQEIKETMLKNKEELKKNVENLYNKNNKCDNFMNFKSEEENSSNYFIVHMKKYSDNKENVNQKEDMKLEKTEGNDENKKSVDDNSSCNSDNKSYSKNLNNLDKYDKYQNNRFDSNNFGTHHKISDTFKTDIMNDNKNIIEIHTETKIEEKEPSFEALGEILKEQQRKKNEKKVINQSDKDIQNNRQVENVQSENIEKKKSNKKKKISDVIKSKSETKDKKNMEENKSTDKDK